MDLFHRVHLWPHCLLYKRRVLICFFNKIRFKPKIQEKTREKRFEWDPWATALIMSAPDLAFMITVVPLEKIIRPMDRGRDLGLRIVFKLKPIEFSK